ncbi:MAG: 6-phosphogluconolactonase [Anaerocolumna sp.]
MKVIKFKDNVELTEYIIDNYFVSNEAKEIIIPSGSTPKHLYKRISKEVDHSNINYYALDEWIGVSKKTIGSCHQMLKTDFTSKINGDYNLITFDGANSYEQEYERLKPITDKIQMDLAILGVGLNGHIGLNEHTNISNKPIIKTKLDPITKKVANEKYFTKNVEIEYGITFSLNYLVKAKNVIVILNTPNKRNIWKIIQESNDQDIPAVYLKQFKNVTFLITADVEK